MRTRHRPLPRTSCDRPAAPLLVLWGARAPYVGPALGLSAHRNAVAALAIGLDAPFGVAHDPRDLSAGYRTCRTAFIVPGRLHHLRTSSDLMAFLYLDPLSRDHHVVRERTKQRHDGVAFDLWNETAIVDCLRRLARGAVPWPEARDGLLRHLGLHAPQRIDRRIACAIERVRGAPADAIDAADLAREAALSVSRFLHLFKENAGVPFRRYRLWCRLGAVVRAAKAGASLTDAAHAGGLAGSAHLSTAFRAMFGLSPSALNLGALGVIEGG